MGVVVCFVEVNTGRTGLIWTTDGPRGAKSMVLLFNLPPLEVKDVFTPFFFPILPVGVADEVDIGLHSIYTQLINQ